MSSFGHQSGLLWAILVLAGVSHSARADESPPSFLGTWGQYGGGPGEFNLPWDVACAPDGTVLVSDVTGRIQRFTNDGMFLQSWTLPPAGINPQASPTLMVCDDLGHVYVCVESGWVEKTTLTGNLITMWRLQQPGPGSVPHAFGIAVGADGNIFVADNLGRNIQKFTPDGQFLLRWGSEGAGPGQFRSVSGLAGDRTGRIYALDSGGAVANHRVQVFDLLGNYLFEWGSQGSGPGQFDTLSDVTVDPMGNVFVSDEKLHRIQKFTADGVFLSMWGSYGTEPSQFQYPTGIGSDLDGSVFVADFFGYRVQKFGYPPVQTLMTTWGRVKAAHR